MSKASNTNPHTPHKTKPGRSKKRVDDADYDFNKPLYLEFRGLGTLPETQIAIDNVLRLLNRAASAAGAKTVFGRKLRTSATVAFVMYDRCRYVRPRPVGRSFENGKETLILPEGEDVWGETVVNARIVLARLRQYCVAAMATSRIERQVAGGNLDALDELPSLPTFYARTYVRDIFGSRYRVMHDRLVAAKVELEKVREVETKLIERKKAAESALDEASEVTGAVTDHIVLTPEIVGAAV